MPKQPNQNQPNQKQPKQQETPAMGNVQSSNKQEEKGANRQP